MNEIEFTTANDDHGRDPTEVEISGSNLSPQSGFSKIADVPLQTEKKIIGGKATAYVCRLGTCLAPVNSPEDLVNLLKYKEN